MNIEVDLMGEMTAEDVDQMGKWDPSLFPMDEKRCPGITSDRHACDWKLAKYHSSALGL